MIEDVQTPLPWHTDPVGKSEHYCFKIKYIITTKISGNSGLWKTWPGGQDALVNQFSKNTDSFQ